MLLIKNGLVFDGSGAEGRQAELLIRDGRVERISATPIPTSELPAGVRVIDAEGRWVLPGFLDTHTHYDAEVLADPGLRESVRHGVTTIAMGSCSLGTVLSGPRDCADIFSRVEALPYSAVLETLEETKTWDSPASYIAAMEARPLGPNIAAFLGHSDLRASVMGLGRSVDPSLSPSEDEMQRMEALVEDALDAGFLGLSTMTNPWDKVGGERYRSARLPSTYASWREYRRLHRILRRRDRVLQSAPNITTKVNVFAFFAETASLFLRKPLKVALISAADTKADPWLSDVLTLASRLLNGALGGNLRWQTIPMPFEVYADGMDLVVFEEFGAGEEALHLADEAERRALLADEDYRRRFRRDYEKRFTPRVWHRDLHDATIVSAPDESLAGRTFGELADERGLHPVDLFLDLVVAHGRGLRWKTTIANHRPDKLVRLASDPNVHVSFADSGAHVRNMAFYNFGLNYLRLIREAEHEGRPVLPLGQAVRKLTAEQAEWYGIDAGTLREGGRADVVIVNPEALDDRLLDYHEAPMEMFGGLSRMVRRNDDAVQATIIAGRCVYEQGTFDDGFGRDYRTGSFLRPGQTAAPPVPAVQRESPLESQGAAA